MLSHIEQNITNRADCVNESEYFAQYVLYFTNIRAFLQNSVIYCTMLLNMNNRLSNGCHLLCTHIGGWG